MTTAIDRLPTPEAVLFDLDGTRRRGLDLHRSLG
jgi:hypothetical protein